MLNSRVDEYMSGTLPKICQNPDPEGEEIFMNAVRRGISISDGVYGFFDPGISLARLWTLSPRLQSISPKTSIARKHGILHGQDWYLNLEWACQSVATAQRAIRLPVLNSNNRCFPDQAKLVMPHEEVSSVRMVTTFLAIRRFLRAQPLCGMYIRCHELDIIGDPGFHVLVEDPGFGGIIICQHWDDDAYTHIWISATSNSHSETSVLS